MGINVLSLCDGISCLQIALKESGLDVDKYYSSEICNKAMNITEENFPNTIQLGDVITLSENKLLLSQLPKIDLVVFGFPCRSQSKAVAGRKEYSNGLKGVSGIFYNCMDILNYIKERNNHDVKFLIENVPSYNKEDLMEIDRIIGVNSVVINSNCFTAQNRERLYWTNIPIKELPTCDLVLNDIMDNDVEEKYFYDKTFVLHGEDKSVAATLELKGHDIMKRVTSRYFKSPTLTSCRGGSHQKKVYDNGRCRKLTPNEYRKLQGIPSWYKMNVCDTDIYNTCGDGMTIPVITHILKGMV